MAVYPTVYRDLRTWLEARGADMGPRSRRRTPYIIAEFLNDTPEEAAEAKDLAKTPPVKRVQFKNELNALHLTLLQAQGKTEVVALEEVYQEITRKAPLQPLTHRGDAHKREVLRSAVVGATWATVPITRIATHELSFQGLYLELTSALLLTQEAEMAAARIVTVPGSASAVNRRVTASVMFTGKGN